MIAHWMVYCAAVGLLLGGGALALERALRACALPTRWAWAGALLLTVAIPAATLALPREGPTAPLPRAAAPAAPGERAPEKRPLREQARRRVDLSALDRPLLLGWGAASGATLLALLCMATVLRRRRAGWRPEELAGVPVLVSRDTGPAVVGLFRGRIVLPEWAAAADPGRRDLLLAHELEHLRAGDPRLLAAGLAALVLVPWNPAVWWQLRRLRLAVEIDCDARVLRRRHDVRAYGALLLEVGRRAGGSSLAAAAFSEPTSFLERRIRIMTTPRERSPRVRAAAFGALTLGLVAAACETPAPTSIAAAPVERVYAAADAPEGLRKARLGPREAIARYFPDVLTKGTEGSGLLTFVLDHEGEVVYTDMGKRDVFLATPAGEPEARVTPDGDGTRVLVRDPSVRAVEGGRTAFRIGSARSFDVDPDQVESVDVMKFPAGKMGPDPVNVVWIRKRDPSAPPSPRRARAAGADRVTVTMRANGAAAGGAVAAGHGHPATDPAVVVRAIEHHHPEVARSAGRAELWFVVGADGRVLRTGSTGSMALDEYNPAQFDRVEIFKGGALQAAGRDLSVIWIRLKP